MAVSLNTSVESIDSAGKGENVINWYISSVTETYVSGSSRDIEITINGSRMDWNANLTDAYATGSDQLWGFSDETDGIISPSDMTFCTFSISCTANESGSATLGSSYYVDISGNSSGSGQRAIRITFNSVSGLTPYVPTYYIYYKKSDGTAYTTDSALKNEELTIRSTGPSKSQSSSDSTFSITGYANGGYFTSATITSQSITATKTVTTTYFFTKWNTKFDGTGTDYTPNTEVTMTKDITLYPIYNSSTKDTYKDNEISVLPTPTKGNTTPYTYTITYDALGGTVSKTTESTSTTRRWSFGGWATSNTASSANAQSSYTSTTNLWAYWTYQDVKGTVTLPTPTRVGYKFLGWGTSKTQTSGLLPAGGTQEIGANTTYYAIWKADGSIRIYINSTDKYKMAMVYVYAPTSSSDSKPWKLAIPYIKMSDKWKIVAG